MTLKEFLQVCSKNDYIGIWNIECSSLKEHKSRLLFEVQPTQQQYYKIGNIPYGRIMYLLDKDVYVVNHTQKGYLVRIGDKQKTHESVTQNHFAYEIAKMIDMYVKR